MSKTVLSVNAPTPQWANWVFRIAFILCGIATITIIADPALSDEFKIRSTVYLQALDKAIWAITRLLGVEVSRDFNVPNQQQNQNPQ